MADIVDILETWSTWELRMAKPLTEADFLWITNNSVRCVVDRKVHNFNNLINSVSRTPVQVAGPTIIKIVTETKQQESMLKLKYGDELLMERIEYRGKVR
jgi:hypothetical protein